jgi:hypothetical protein
VKGNIYELVPYLRSRNLVHVLNHPLQNIACRSSRCSSWRMSSAVHPRGDGGSTLPRSEPGRRRHPGYGRRMGLTLRCRGTRADAGRQLRHPRTGEDRRSGSLRGGRNCVVAGREISLLDWWADVGVVSRTTGTSAFRGTAPHDQSAQRRRPSCRSASRARSSSVC